MSRLIRQLSAVLMLLSASLVAQEKDRADNPQAAEALAAVVQKKDLGKFQFDKSDMVTMKQNDRVPGLGGLVFAYYKDDAGSRIMLEILWFEYKDKLLAFYDSQLKTQLKQQKELKKSKVEDSVIWGNGDKAYYWTDGEHFVVSMGGAPIPPEMAKSYLKLVPSRVAELGVKEKKK